MAENNLARALRRHHRARIKQARRHYWGRLSACMPPLTDAQLGRLVHTAHLCSGFCCGNPRKWLGELTVQERRWQQESVEQLLADDLAPEDEFSGEAGEAPCDERTAG